MARKIYARLLICGPGGAKRKPIRETRWAEKRSLVRLATIRVWCPFLNFFRNYYEAFRGSSPVAITPRESLPPIPGPGSLAGGRRVLAVIDPPGLPSVGLCVCGGSLMVAGVPYTMEMSQIIHSTHHTHERRPSITASPDSFPLIIHQDKGGINAIH